MSVRIGSGKIVCGATGSPPGVLVSTKFAAGVAGAFSFATFCISLDCVTAFPVSGDKPQRYVGLWTATVSSSLLACRFKFLDNIGEVYVSVTVLTQLYVSVMVLMKHTALGPVLVKRELACGEPIVAGREVGRENGTGSRQLVSDSNHSRFKHVRGDGDFLHTESGPINAVHLNRLESIHE